VLFAIALAVLAAFLFGSASPLSKLILRSVSPFQLAGLLYLGAALRPRAILKKGLRIWRSLERAGCR
jgi:drug/metabolite transporter (DMT)-like permease